MRRLRSPRWRAAAVLTAIAVIAASVAVGLGGSISGATDPGPPDTETPIPTTAPPTTAPPTTASPPTTQPPPTFPPLPEFPSPPAPAPSAEPSPAPLPGPAPAPGAPPSTAGGPARSSGSSAAVPVAPPIPFAASTDEIASRAEQADELLRASTAADLIDAGADPAAGAPRTQEQLDAVAAIRMQQALSYQTARDELARAVASRAWVLPQRLIAEWSSTPNETLAVVYFSLAQLGKPSEPGQTGPTRYDASSLAFVGWARAGVQLPRWSADQVTQFPQVAFQYAHPGDVAAYGMSGGTESGVYLGAGIVALAPAAGGGVDVQPAFRPDFAGVARPSGVVPPEQAAPNPVQLPAPKSVGPTAPQPDPGHDPLAFMGRTALADFDNNAGADVRRRNADLALRTPALLGSAITRDQAKQGVPAQLVPVYQSAARTCPAPADWWAVLAAIAAHESGYGTANQSSLRADGSTTKPIYGPVLDGSGTGGNTSAIFDTDGGRWDADAAYDRAVGPMQFLPSTWARYGVRAPERGAGEADPQNILDATYSAAKYLCAAQGGAVSNERAALLSYNGSDSYVDAVLGAAARIAAGAPAQVPSLHTAPSTEQLLVATRAKDDARQTRSTLTDSVTNLAKGLADRFGVGSDRLLEEWRWAPPAALRATLWALAQLGRPVSDGDAAFTAASWARGGVKLPPTAHEQYADGVAVDATQLRPGDLVAIGPEGSDHVGMYVGEGVMIHVSQPDQPVQVDG